jgi:hypothetical protein
MTGLIQAVVGALLLAALNTFGDFVWARFIPRHRAVLGLVHGALLCLAIGGYLGALRRRPLRGALAGAGIGFGAALCYYALAPLLRFYAMFPAWMALWAGFALLDARGLARGVLAALASGAAFYAISGIWTRPQPGGPDYVTHFLSWTAAFLPAFLALLVGGARDVPASAR